MCSIAFLYRKDCSINQLTEEVKAMNRASAHRGPDNTTVWTDKLVGLGHNRLSIIDTSHAADQPFHFNHLHLVFNGCIYNYIDLKEILISHGYYFRTSSDTEVILAAYAHWGVDCFNYFNGMWAMIIYDKKEQKIIVSRDRFGIKPCYYLLSDDKFACASEIKQLLHLSQKESNDSFIYQYFLSGDSNFDYQTWWNDIHVFENGHFAIFDISRQQFVKTCYYKIPSEGIDTSTSNLKDIIDSSISLRLRSDVPIGLTLSGGIDSAIIASYLPAHGKAFTSSFPGWKLDESERAQQSADINNLMLDKCETNWSEFIHRVGEVSYIHDAPVNSYAAFSSFKLYERIRVNGIKVTLDGQGADELFGGYDTYQLKYLTHLLFSNPLKGLNELNSTSITKARRKHIISYLLSNNKLYSWIHHRRKISLHSKKYDFSEFNYLSQLGLHAIYIKGLQNMLMSVDRNSMAHGIESRIPFLDHRLVEIAMNLDDTQKINNGKRKVILRALFVGKVPPNILNRTVKQGYSSPQDLLVSQNMKIITHKIKSLSDLLPSFVHKEKFFYFLTRTTDYRIIFRVWTWLEWKAYTDKAS